MATGSNDSAQCAKSTFTCDGPDALRTESSMKLNQFPRYAQVAHTLWKHRELFSLGEDDELFLEIELSQGDSGAPEELADDLEALGPTYIKLGQLLSGRADLLPRPYLDALARLQDDTEPFEFSEVERIIYEELGVRPSKAFSELEPTPMAAASLGQVHRARLRDGRPVVVKVQRPNVRGQILEDLEMLETIAEGLEGRGDQWRHVDLIGSVADLRRSLLDELDYRREAENLLRLDRTLSKYPHLVVPHPISDFCSGRVLTMDRIDGAKITELHRASLIDLDGDSLVDELFRGYLDQVLVDGFFHADPHAGNLLLTPDRQIAILDLGMVARLPQRFREHLTQLLVAVGEGHGHEVANLALAMGKPFDDFDRETYFQRMEARVDEANEKVMESVQLSEILLDISRIAAETGIRLPRQFVVLGKTIMHLEEVARCLAPELDPRATLRRHSTSLVDNRMREMWSPSAVLSRLMDVKELVEEMPGRVNQLLTTMTESGLRIDVDALDEDILINGFQKIANRVTSGLILAALIIGAAMLMQVPSGFQIFGYPGLAIILFSLAAGGGVMLLWNILQEDRKG